MNLGRGEESEALKREKVSRSRRPTSVPGFLRVHTEACPCRVGVPRRVEHPGSHDRPGALWWSGPGNEWPSQVLVLPHQTPDPGVSPGLSLEVPATPREHENSACCTGVGVGV